jgi:hypothetical protein
MKVTPATIQDLIYIDSLQRKNAEELAFYPRQVFEREIENSRILLAWINGDPVGYLYRGALGSVCRVHQACIQYDARGYLYGAALVRHLEALCTAANVLTISLRCGSDIAANGFWKAMGFDCVSVTPGGVRRMRDINCWTKAIQPELFSVAVEPSTRKQDASIWRRRGNKAAQSQFIRGADMRAYRNAILADAKE